VFLLSLSCACAGTSHGNFRAQGNKLKKVLGRILVIGYGSGYGLANWVALYVVRYCLNVEERSCSHKCWYPFSFLFLYYDQQMHNYITNYHTPTCFDTIVSSSGRLLSMPWLVTQVFQKQLLVIQFINKMFHIRFIEVLVL